MTPGIAGNAYYIDPHRRTCSAIKFGVSILTPDWQLEGEYLGRRLVDGMSCYSWRKGFGEAVRRLVACN